MKIKTLIDKLQELDEELDLLVIDENDEGYVIWDICEGEEVGEGTKGMIWIGRK